MAKNDLVIQQVGSDIHILGILDAAEGHIKHANNPRELKIGLMIKAADAREDEIESAVSMAVLMSDVIDGKHIKFASPIVIKTAANPIGLQAQLKRDVQDKKQRAQGEDIMLSDPRLQRIFEPQSEPDKPKEDEPDTNISQEGDSSPTKRGVAYAIYGPTTDQLVEMLEKAASLIGKQYDDELVKEARSYANTPFFTSIRHAKVDGNKLGFDMPCRVEFGNSHLKDAFLLMGKTTDALKIDPDTFKQHEDSSPNQMSDAMQAEEKRFADRLAKSSAFKAPVDRLLAGLRGAVQR
jgi:hypothetical protein